MAEELQEPEKKEEIPAEPEKKKEEEPEWLKSLQATISDLKESLTPAAPAATSTPVQEIPAPTPPPVEEPEEEPETPEAPAPKKRSFLEWLM